jgi:hypothetical protein
MTATPTTTTIVERPVIMNMTERERHIQEQAALNVDSLPKSFSATRNKDPLIPGRNRIMRYANRAEHQFAATIVDINEHQLKVFHYLWLTDNTRRYNSRYAGYVQVRDDNKFSMCQDGSDDRIPAHYFHNHVIYDGNLSLYACEIPYYKSEQADVTDLCERRVGTFQKGKTMKAGEDDPNAGVKTGFVEIADSEGVSKGKRRS